MIKPFVIWSYKLSNLLLHSSYSFNKFSEALVDKELTKVSSLDSRSSLVLFSAAFFSAEYFLVKSFILNFRKSQLDLGSSGK